MEAGRQVRSHCNNPEKRYVAQTEEAATGVMRNSGEEVWREPKVLC